MLFRLTLTAADEGGLTLTVAKAGAPVSPALISPPSPLDLLRARGVSLLFGPERGVNLSFDGVASSGKASVLAAGIFEDRI